MAEAHVEVDAMEVADQLARTSHHDPEDNPVVLHKNLILQSKEVTYDIVEGDDAEGDEDSPGGENKDVAFHGLDAHHVIEHFHQHQLLREPENESFLAVLARVAVHDGVRKADHFRHELVQKIQTTSIEGRVR